MLNQVRVLITYHKNSNMDELLRLVQIAHSYGKDGKSFDEYVELFGDELDRFGNAEDGIWALDLASGLLSKLWVDHPELFDDDDEESLDLIMEANIALFGESV